MARDVLADSGSIFVQIGDENVHRVRILMDEVFGDTNFVSEISVQKTGYATADQLPNLFDSILFYAKNIQLLKFRKAYSERRDLSEDFHSWDLASAGEGASTFGYEFQGEVFHPSANRHWKTQREGLDRASKADRLFKSTNSLRYKRYDKDFSVSEIHNTWTDTISGSFHEPRRFVVETSPKILQRCVLMTTDPGDLVLDPTCGSGTTAYVAEQWGRRWITIDTSRVALALARSRIMGARYPYYLLADTPDGQVKEAEISRRAPSEMPTYGNVRQGFVYERVPHITLRDIANNAEIDVIWEEYQKKLEPLREELNAALSRDYEEWQVPREASDPWPESASEAWLVVKGPDKMDADKAAALRILNMELGRNYKIDEVPDHPLDPWEPLATDLHSRWWEHRIARQKKIDASIAAKADYEYMYDKPYEDRSKVRVAGPFTVESISPHRVLGVDENGEVIDSIAEPRNGYGTGYDFGQVILENLKRSGVQQAHKEDRITFTSLTPWPGRFVCAEGRYVEGGDPDDDDAVASGPEKRAAIFIGPEFGTVSRPDLVEAAREAAECGFDVLIACAFNYDAHTTEFESLGRIPVLKARMNADLHMAGELKNTGTGNLFVIFGEPDIDVQETGDGQLQVQVNGVDVFHPNTGEVRSDGPEGIACWFIDTDYNQESFFVRRAYFLGSGDPYRSLKTTLRAEIDEDAWAILNSATSRPFPKPESGRIAVKVINHLGDEVMKVFRVG